MRLGAGCSCALTKLPSSILFLTPAFLGSFASFRRPALRPFRRSFGAHHLFHDDLQSLGFWDDATLVHLDDEYRRLHAGSPVGSEACVAMGQGLSPRDVGLRI